MFSIDMSSGAVELLFAGRAGKLFSGGGNKGRRRGGSSPAKTSVADFRVHGDNGGWAMLVSVHATGANVPEMSEIALALPLLMISLGGMGARALLIAPILTVSPSGAVDGFSSSVMLLYFARNFLCARYMNNMGCREGVLMQNFVENRLST